MSDLLLVLFCWVIGGIVFSIIKPDRDKGISVGVLIGGLVALICAWYRWY